ncbi:MAG: hypothetical protein J6B45_02550 [Clostridia bacterium]|nr:hypothetical protein [Clostridia bacterium]
MNKKLKVILFAVLAIVTILLVTSCGDNAYYALLDEEGYQVSIQYDANGGEFAKGTTVIVDTYGLNSLPTKEGKKIAKLINPNDEIRGAGKVFAVKNPGYQFVGWYEERIETTDASGEVSYTYSKPWNFESDRLELDPNKEYRASEPVKTLYAAWIPQFEYEFYSLDNPTELLKEYKVEVGAELVLPEWDTKSGNIKMHQFPTIKGKTFVGAYTDPEGKNQITEASIKHTGTLDESNVTVKDPVMKIYIDTMDGEWKHIYTVAQLKNMSLNGNYILQQDLDLGNKTRNWDSSFVSGKFTGKLVGKEKENGEPVKIKNLAFYQESGAAIFSIGMFGQIGDGAVIENIAFENVTMDIDVGAPLRSGVSFGLLAGTISENAVIENVTISGTINIDSGCSFAGDYMIGLVCGLGDRHGVDYSKIQCVAVGDKAQDLIIEVTQDTVALDFSKIAK